MKIVIVAGGTGSIALQTGMFELLDKTLDGIDTKVLVNAYDNGLSTGAVRRVMNGKILGPSDVRKNQTTRLKLEQPNSQWLPFLEIRFTAESGKAKEFCLEQINRFEIHQQAVCQDKTDKVRGTYALLREAVDSYFEVPGAAFIDYNDFSLANIIYAGFAKANNNSLREAARIMALLMGIPDNVILNDDTSLFLGAITKSGKRITDEGDIVSWGNTQDPFVDVFFTDANGKVTAPKLCKEAKDALENANLIILSSGTQWSSLIPTYATEGFREAIENSKAKVVMVMNRQPDKDSPGQTGTDIMNILVPKYFAPERINLILDPSGSPQMNDTTVELTKLVQTITRQMMKSDWAGPATHNPSLLAIAVGRAYFDNALYTEHVMFDYDDTLVGRGNRYPKSSAVNKTLIMTQKNKTPVSICTGNSIKAIHLAPEEGGIHEARCDLHVYADGGVNKYRFNSQVNNSDDAVKHDFMECVDPSVILPKSGFNSVDFVMSRLAEAEIPISKIENRGDVTISIKPVDPEYRKTIVKYLTSLLGDGFSVTATGRTTIDISRKTLSKANAVQHVLAQGYNTVTFVGDEFIDGNDKPVMDMDDPNVICLHVSSPPETAFFLRTLNAVSRTEQ